MQLPVPTSPADFAFLTFLYISCAYLSSSLHKASKAGQGDLALLSTAAVASNAKELLNTALQWRPCLPFVQDGVDVVQTVFASACHGKQKFTSKVLVQ